LNLVRSELSKIPGVRIIDIDGVHDLRLKYISAPIEVTGHRNMTLIDLDRSSFHGSDHLRLRAIGPYSIHFIGENYHGLVEETAPGKPMLTDLHASDADISAAGEFAWMFPFKVTNVRDAVTRYDEILDVISKWPREPSKSFRAKNDADFYYYVKPFVRSAEGN
jgi:hypothetical protein